MILNLAVCDDDLVQIDNIKQLVSLWASRLDFTVNIKEFISAESFLFHNEGNINYDIILLDIEMGEINGVELAKRIRKYSDSVQIIFITGYSDYIADGYEVSALHYLMKPLDEEKFYETLNRALEKVKRNEKKLLLESSEGLFAVPIYQIVYIEVVKNYITVYAKENYTARMTLTDVFEKLDRQFFKIGRSYIVNLTYINSVSKTHVNFTNGSIVPLPRGMYDKLNRAIIDL